ncbi:unnamed protein product [Cuscuta campestris]|uniref:Integrase catalytic domain-containing protein n=1 Tax=Cuscuta campestris TaxID=132261 RepID=A0A484L0S0_9ASTE|nr:unnamed protein product [Cuscuta campestris]
MRVDAPRFSGDDPTRWIFRIQKYFDYFLTPEPERLQLVAMLIDHPASEWFHYYMANNFGASWDAFLLAVQQRFDPHYYENYVGLLSKLTQTTSVMEYETAFESILNKVLGVLEPKLISMFVAGLRQPIQREVNLRNPASVPATFTLARELSACHAEAAATYTRALRRQWPPRPPPPSPTSAGLLPTPGSGSTSTAPPPRPPDRSPISRLPVVRVTNAEKTERSKKGLCWYCDEKWDASHNCQRRFLVLMGPEDDDTTASVTSPPPDEDDTPLLSGDISSILSLAGSPSPRSLKVAGSVHNNAVQVLLDSGSTHNFIHPSVAERLALVIHPVSPFRVYVGNGDSLRCSYSCPQAALLFQGNLFSIDLYLLEIHGPNIVLGVQWLQMLRKVTHDYAKMTMEFTWHGELHPDTEKIKAMLDWPKPIAIKHLRGFLERLKTTMTMALALRLPDFSQTFYLETDASDTGVGAVLLQQGHSLAFFSKKLGPRRRVALIYHKELYAIMEAVQKWRQYLLGREFVIRSDQRSLKELLSQVIQTPDQQFYVRKLMGYKFRIKYKTGASNRAVDALSRREEDPEVASLLLHDIQHENTTTDDLGELHAAVTAGTTPPHFSEHHGLLYFKCRLLLSAASTLRQQLLHEYHATPLAEHQGVERTFRRLADEFYWPGMRDDVRRFVASCEVCQTTKYSTRKPASLLQPLPIPDQVWESASMDFIMVVVDCLTKYSHFGTLATGFDASKTKKNQNGRKAKVQVSIEETRNVKKGPEETREPSRRLHRQTPGRRPARLHPAGNGNFLGLIEMLQEFDLVIREHVRRSTNDELHVLYLGHKIQNELILDLAQEIKKEITKKIKEAKYYSIILDCTPDTSHQEQMSMIVRYLNFSGNSITVEESFLGFLNVNHTTEKGLFDVTIEELKSLGLEIDDIHGQGYDNGANMKGKHQGVQKTFLDVNLRAFYTPCGCHSLNLTLCDMDQSCVKGKNFFGAIQKLYIIFAHSINRWQILKDNVKGWSLKPLSQTRWESCVESIKAIRMQLSDVREALLEVEEKDSDNTIVHTAKSLTENLSKF